MNYEFDKNYLKLSSKERVEAILSSIAPENFDMEEKDKLDEEHKTDNKKTPSCVLNAVKHARDIANLPNNYLHPEDFCLYAEWIAKAFNMEYKTYGTKELTKLGCGGILAVNQGSRRDARLIVMKHEGIPGGEFTGLIGKGLMFDSGGYHLKSTDGMEGMQYDMCGAADVLAVMEVLGRTKAKTNVLAVIPAVENLIGPEAVCGGDVITMMSGKTVEVVFTDAEGRLVLADAMTYAIKAGCKQLIDAATLTYSCMNALGTVYTGLFSNNDAMADRFLAATKRAGEKAWRLPLDEEYQKALHQSLTADVRNYVKGPASACTAAGFLWEFCEDLPWLHLDMVGTASSKYKNEENPGGATGAMIRSLVEYLTGGLH